MADRKIVQCVSSFHAALEGAPLVVRTGDLYFADDVVVKGRENHFADVLVKSTGVRKPSRTPVGSVEEATATPGGRRRMTRPKDEQRSEGENKPKDDEV